MPIPPFRLLEYGGGPKGQLLRVLVPGNRVKYILVDIGMWVHGDGSSEKALANMLPLPSNETWKCLRVFKNAGNGELDYIILHGALPGILNHCHLRMVEYVDLLGLNMANPTVEAQYARRTSVIEVHKSEFAVPVFAKFAVWPDSIKNIDQESQAYGLLHNHGIGPKVLAHIAEEGRIIGLVLERLEGHVPTIDDHAACQQALDEFHDRGLQHGNVKANSFLVKDGRATVIDFEEVAQFSNSMQRALENSDLWYALTEGDGPEYNDDDI